MSIQKKSFLVFALVSMLFCLEKSSLATGVDSSILIGPTFSNHSFDSSSSGSIGASSSMGVGYSFGSFFGGDFSDVLGAEVGVFFTKRTTAFPSDVNYNTTILNIPVLLRIAPISGLHGLKFEIGPYFGLLPTASVTRGSSTFASSANVDAVDVGAMGGLSYFAPINENIMFRITALYSYGFTDMSSGSAEIKTRGFDTYLGIVILK